MSRLDRFHLANQNRRIVTLAAFWDIHVFGDQLRLTVWQKRNARTKSVYTDVNPCAIKNSRKIFHADFVLLWSERSFAA